MIRKSLLALTVTVGMTGALSTPAHATWGNWFHKHYCDCGHSSGSSQCGGTSTTSGVTSSTSTTSGGTTTSTGGDTGGSSGGSSGGTEVPEPGMLGMLGLGLLGIAAARRRKTRA